MNQETFNQFVSTFNEITALAISHLKDYCIIKGYKFEDYSYANIICDIDEDYITLNGERHNCSCCPPDRTEITIPIKFLIDGEYRQNIIDQYNSEIAVLKKAEEAKSKRKKSNAERRKKEKELKMLEALKNKYE